MIPAYGWIGQRGEFGSQAVTELADDANVPRVCPCGSPSAPGETWRTTWFDGVGIPVRTEITRLCSEHRARRYSGPYVGHMDCTRFGCGPEHCEFPECRTDTMGQA